MTPSVTNCIEVQMPFELFWHKISQIGLKLWTMPVILKRLTKKVENLSGRGLTILWNYSKGIEGDKEFWKFWKMEAVLGMVWTQGATSRKIGWWCAAHFLKPLPYFRTKSVIFPTLFQTWSKMWSPVSDLLKNQFPRSDQCWRQCLYAFLSRVQNCTKLYCYGTYTVGVNIRREMVLSPNDEEVASSKKHTQFKTRVHKPYPTSHQNDPNWYPISDQSG